MILKYFTILSAILLAVCSAYFSVIGLMEIFAGNMVYAAIGCTALEIAKIATALLLHKHWQAPGLSLVRFPLVVFTIILMVITSAGVFGMFAKGAQVHNASNELNVNQSAFLREQLTDIEKRKAELQKQIASLDGMVGIYTSQQNFNDARVGVRLYERQKQQRKALNEELKALQLEEQELKKSSLQLRNESSKIELEIGPAVYLAEIIYGEKSTETIDKAIRIVIILLVFVFDPLAICLLIAAQNVYSRKEEKEHVSEAVEEVIVEKEPEINHSISNPEFTEQPKDDIIVHVKDKSYRFDEDRSNARKRK